MSSGEFGMLKEMRSELIVAFAVMEERLLSKGCEAGSENNRDPSYFL